MPLPKLARSFVPPAHLPGERGARSARYSEEAVVFKAAAQDIEQTIFYVSLNFECVTVIAALDGIAWARSNRISALIFIAKCNQGEDMRIETIIRLRINEVLIR